MKMKYYTSGNGNRWVVDLWTGPGRFEKQKEFRVKSVKPSQRQKEYTECKTKAIRYMKKLMIANDIEAVGGQYD